MMLTRASMYDLISIIKGVDKIQNQRRQTGCSQQPLQEIQNLHLAFGDIVTLPSAHLVFNFVKAQQSRDLMVRICCIFKELKWQKLGRGWVRQYEGTASFHCACVYFRDQCPYLSFKVHEYHTGHTALTDYCRLSANCEE